MVSVGHLGFASFVPVARSVVAFLAVIGILVLVHEMGHYVAARLVGVRVRIFSVGFGRALWSRESRGGTVWRLGVVPLGGFVRLEGLESAVAGSRLVGFAAKGVTSRAFVYAAGPLANLAFAWVAFMVVVASIGAPPTSLLVSSLMPGAPAASAGIKVGDVIVAVDGVPVSRISQLQAAISRGRGAPLRLQVDRSGIAYGFDVVPTRADGRLVVGLSSDVGLRAVPAVDVPVAAFHWAREFTVETLDGLWTLVSGSASVDAMGGPIKIAQVSGQAVSLGFGRFVLLIAFLSINLGIINLVPIPFLDGGHLLFCAIEAVMGRPVSPRVFLVGNSVGFALVVGLMTFATLNDIINLEAFKRLVGG